MQNPDNLHIDSLSGDWCDKDIVMLHACFQLLTDCIEKENLLTRHIDWDHNDDFRNAKQEIEQLYTWWTERKENEKLDKLHELEKDQYNQDNEMLIRLIKVRQYLWT